MNYTITRENNFLNLSFCGVPAADVRDFLKSNGFRWYAPKKVWYTKDEQALNAFIAHYKNEGQPEQPEQPKQPEQPLFTRLNQYDYSNFDSRFLENGKPGYSQKIWGNFSGFIAAAKKYLQEYFKPEQLKLSMTSGRGGYHNTLNAYIMGSIFDQNSEILKAIQNYCQKWIDAFNYDNSDIMSDYFDVGFYGGYFQLYNYKQIATDNLQDIEQEYNKEKEAKEQQDHQDYLKKCEQEKQEQEKRKQEQEKIEQENRKQLDTILTTCKVKNLDDKEKYFLSNCISNGGKQSLNESIESFTAHPERKENLTDVEIIREIHLNNEQEIELLYNYFLYEDITLFYQGCGGSSTFDNRISTMDDFYSLTKEQRQTIKFYTANSVAVYVNNEIKLIVNPEGFTYARYLLFTTDKTQKISYADYEKIEIEKLKDKKAFYRPASLENQLKQAEQEQRLKQDQVITVITDNNWMGAASAKVWKFNKYEKTSYAQYDNAIAFYGTPKAEKRFKSGIYYTHFYNSPKVIILDGEFIVPDSVKYESIKNENGFICKTSIIGPDSNYWNRLKAYLRENNIKSIVDTVAE